MFTAKDIDFLKGLLPLLQRYDGKCTKVENALIEGIHRIFNMCKDVNDCWHGDDGKFISKPNNNISKININDYKFCTDDKINEIREKIVPNLANTTPKDRQKISLLLAAYGLSNKDIAKCLYCSIDNIKRYLEEAFDNSFSENSEQERAKRTKTIVNALLNGNIDIKDIDDPHLSIRYKETEREIEEFKKAAEKYRNGTGENPLTQGQRECLLWVAAGCKNEEIAQYYKGIRKDNTTVNNIRKFLDETFKTLVATNRTHAVVIALKYELITQNEISERIQLIKDAVLT